VVRGPQFEKRYHKWYDFRKEFTEHKMCVLIFCTTFVWNISRSRKNSARYYHECAYVFMQNTRYSCHILMKHQFSRHFSKNIQISNLINIRPVGAELFHADGRTCRCDEANRRFSQFLWTRLRSIPEVAGKPRRG